MKKNFRQKSTWLIILLFSGTALVGWSASLQQVLRKELSVSPVYAEDDNEYENEGDDDNYSSPSSSSSPQTTKVKSAPIYKTVLVTKVITTLDPIFTTDQDDDGIVDGLDPHPNVHEREYFTDEDDDGIANAFDKHHDEDDFAYYEEETDTNDNGLLDSYESMAGR